MADRMAANILIGGAVSKATAKELCAVVRDTGASLGWGEGVFAPHTIEELLEAIDDGCLHLYDDERAWGEFENLEAFLREHEIPYDRQTASRYEYDAEKAIYRPDAGLEVILTTGSGNPVVEVTSLQPVVRSMALLCKQLAGRRVDKDSLWRRAVRLQRLLRSKLPREMPPLEPFMIVE